MPPRRRPYRLGLQPPRRRWGVEVRRVERVDTGEIAGRLRRLSSAAAVAAVAAIALGLWAASLSRDLDGAEGELAVLGDPSARTYESANGEADLVVTPSGDAALVVRNLAPAPAGKDYEIWVFEDGVPRRAGLFERPGVALLERRVEPGQMVAVTLEADGGVDAPTGAPVLTATSA